MELKKVNNKKSRNRRLCEKEITITKTINKLKRRKNRKAGLGSLTCL